VTKGELTFRMIENWCRHNGYPIPVAEHQFHPTRKWRFDVAFIDLKVAVELQGGVWKSKSGHNTGVGITKDTEKACNAAVMGWRVLPVTYDQVKKGKLYDWLESIFTEGVK
jgi:hypothetical protein